MFADLLRPLTDRFASERTTIPTPARPMPPDVVAVAERAAADMAVDPRIHPSDFIFWADYDRLNGDAYESVMNYFVGGQRSASDLTEILAHYLKPGRCSLLDFASGYCRIARHFKASAPKMRVTIADIHPEAVAFARQLGLGARRSTWNPRDFKPGRFDATIAISFFTHVPREEWAPWLAALTGALKEGGVLIFTTHGYPAMPPMGITEPPADGFGFYQQSEQKDLDMDRYATTLTLPDFVRSAAASVGLDIKQFREGGFGYQDLWVALRKTPARRGVWRGLAARRRAPTQLRG